MVDSIKSEKAGQKIDIPGSILIFSPVSTGKTMLGHAIAEEAGCTTTKVECGFRVSDKTRTEFIENLEKEAVNAEERFKQDRTRTIVFIDNLTRIVSKESNILKPFEKFIKTCSERYHFMVVGTTCHPSELGVNLEDAKVFPFRIALNPPTSNDTAEIFKHYLDGRTSGVVNYDLLANSLIKTVKKEVAFTVLLK